MTEQNEAPGLAAETQKTISCDQEAWLLRRLETLVNMAYALRHERHVAADNPAYRCALEGLVNGTAVEITSIFYTAPSYENLRRVPRIGGAYMGPLGGGPMEALDALNDPCPTPEAP